MPLDVFFYKITVQKEDKMCIIVTFVGITIGETFF